MGRITKTIHEKIRANSVINKRAHLEGLMASGYSIVFSSRANIPSTIYNTENILSINQKTQGLVNGLIYSDEFILDLIDKHENELDVYEGYRWLMNNQIDYVCTNQIMEITKVNDRLGIEISDTKRQIDNIGFFRRLVMRNKLGLLNDRLVIIQTQIMTNKSHIERINSMKSEFVSITKNR